MNLKDRKTQNLFIYTFLALVLLLSNFYVYNKLIKVKEIFNPYLFLFILNIDIIFLLIIIGSSLKYLIKVLFEGNIIGKLRVKLFVILVSLIIVPSILLFTVSVSLISSATNLWFSGKVGSAIGRVDEIVSYNLITNQEWLNKLYALLYKGDLSLKDAYNNFGLTTVALFNRENRLLEFYGEPLNLEIMASINKDGSHITTDSIVFSGILRDGNRILLVYKLPSYLLLSKDEIALISQIYTEFKFYKTPVRIGYILILLTITVGVIFAGFWFSRFISRQITYPLEELTKAVDKLSSGDLSVKVNIKASDEIGILITEFNRMVDHLAFLYQKLQDKNLILKKNKEYLEAILDNIKTGVIYSSPEGIIENINKSAISILGEDTSKLKKQHISSVKSILNIDLSSEKEQTVQKDGKTIIIKVKHIDKDGYVIVIDDITQIILAQKLNTWKEIAQRIAHEIKNPLTPIKLSAERILNQSRKGNPNLQEIIEKSTQVIFTEVEHLSNLVKDFSQFGKSFTNPEFSVVDICEILNEVKENYNVEDFHINISCQGDLKTKADRKLIKQAFSNIVQNSFESASQLWIKAYKENHYITIEFLDNGPGISQQDIDKIFLPYYSKKPKGSGLGLTITKEIIDSHKGFIKALYNKDGAHIVIKLKEENDGYKESRL